MDYRFQKGQSGNPTGRPRTSAAAKQKLSAETRDQILKIADRRLPTSDGEKTAFEIQLKAEQALGIKGDSRALKHSLDRTILAKAEEADAIKEDHAYWQRYTRLAQALEKVGDPFPDTLPHPKDLVFEADKFVQIIGGDPKIAAENRAFVAGLRDIMILKAGRDYRTVDRSRIDQPLQSEILVVVFNDALPARYQLDDTTLLRRLNYARQTKKRELEKRIRKNCIALDLPDITRIPPGTITKEDVRYQLGALLR